MRLRKSYKILQHIVKYIRRADIRPSLLTHLGNRFRVQTAYFRKYGFGQGTAHFHGASAPLFERRIIEIRVGIRVQYLVRKLRWYGSVHGEAADFSRTNRR